MNMDVYLASQRAKAKTIRARADARLRELGGNGRRKGHRAGDFDDHYEKPPLRSSSTAGLSAAELDRDTASIRHILNVWKAIGKRTPSPVKLASGRWFIPQKSTGHSVSQRETAIGRPLKGRR